MGCFLLNGQTGNCVLNQRYIKIAAQNNSVYFADYGLGIRAITAVFGRTRRGLLERTTIAGNRAKLIFYLAILSHTHRDRYACQHYNRQVHDQQNQ